jgi:hypothetical protein
MIALVHEIAMEAVQTAFEILQIIEVMERQNSGRINSNLSESGAARAGFAVRNALLSRLVLLVAGAFAPARQPGDKHLRKGFELLDDAAVRRAVESTGSADSMKNAIHNWNQLQADPRMATIKHFRDKFTAHLATPKAGTPLPKYAEFFAFARALTVVMENFAHGADVTTEKLNESSEDMIASAQAFWKPWE